MTYLSAAGEGFPLLFSLQQRELGISLIPGKEWDNLGRVYRALTIKFTTKGFKFPDWGLNLKSSKITSAAAGKLHFSFSFQSDATRNKFKSMLTTFYKVEFR